TITPQILSKRGYGGDLEYRYILDRQSRGQWLVSFIQDTTADRSRAVLTGSHAQFVTPTLSIRAQGNYLTDRTILENLSNSGVLRALPSQESYLSVNQQHDSGNLYLFGQYLQPLGAGGRDTFQRLPELGHSMVGVAPFDGPVLIGLDSTFVNFFREEGFGFNRADVVPGVSTEVLDLGHVIGLTPQFKFRETYYTRGVTTVQSVHRETFWAGVQATSRMARRFRFDEGGSLLHTIEPRVFYEYVPPSDQSDIIVVDAIDDLPKKHLVTYSTRTRLLGQHAEGRTTNWLDLTVAQSYRLGAAQGLARAFPFPGDPQFSSLTQPLQPVQVPIEGKKFSDVWLRAVLGNPVGAGPKQSALSLTVDAFLDPYQVEFSQINTDLRYQQETDWYLEVGQRYTHPGNRVRRGDIWNPLSFGEVFAPTPELEFLTAAGAVRLPFSWTVGARTYYDIDRGKSPETDVVALYQNPCRCWSLGLFYIKFPDREQYNFLISLTGVGATESLGVQVLRAILSPLLEGERGLPWAPGRSRQTTPSPTVGTAQ
ncbi:MAG: LPS-assembly protein LptD, partial [Nitrospirales bacterium]